MNCRYCGTYRHEQGAYATPTCGRSECQELAYHRCVRASLIRRLERSHTLVNERAFLLWLVELQRNHGELTDRQIAKRFSDGIRANELRGGDDDLG